METNKNSGKRTTAIIISLFILSLLGNVMFFGKQSGLKSERNRAVLRMDSLLSVKLLVDKELDQAKTEIDSYKGKNSELDKTLVDMDSKLSASKTQVEKLVNDNASVNVLRKKLKESQKLRDECQKVVNDYIKDNEKLQAQNSMINQSNNKLSQELADLKEKLELAKNLKAYDMMIVNFRVSGKSSNPTVKARKVNRISATFDLAENPIADAGFKEVYMIVYNPKGEIVGPQNKKFTKKSDNQEKMYSTSKPLEYKNQEVKTTINFDTNEKLVKGKYKVEIYIDGAYSGKKEFVLR